MRRLAVLAFGLLALATYVSADAPPRPTHKIPLDHRGGAWSDGSYPPPPPQGFSCKAPADQRFKGDCERDRCLHWDEILCLQRRWGALFAGITDGGVAAREILAPELVYYSQSDWWVEEGNPYYGRNATGPWPFDYPPMYTSREELISDYTTSIAGNATYLSGPYIIACNAFTVYWRGAIGGNSTRSWVNGIDMLYVRPGTYWIEAAFSEWNTLAYASSGVVI